MINKFFRIKDGFCRKLSNIIYKARIKNVGAGTYFDLDVKIHNPQKISIGKNCNINSGVILQSCEDGEIKIGNGVIISYNTTILTGGMDLDKFPNERGHISKNVIIEDNVWIGANCTILPGVTIASNSVVAAGSVVTKDVKSKTIVAGVPAKIIKEAN